MDPKIIPKPSFHSCDETSMHLQWDSKPFESLENAEQYQFKLQYKEVHEKWEQSKEFVVPSHKTAKLTLTQADVVDLKPGTPYYVRIAILNTVTNEVTVGPETVFDTKPVDCTPKGKRCVIS
jgi:hypothetical protein